jgi:hypothetical protein
LGHEGELEIHSADSPRREHPRQVDFHRLSVQGRSNLSSPLRSASLTRSHRLKKIESG